MKTAIPHSVDFLRMNSSCFGKICLDRIQYFTATKTNTQNCMYNLKSPLALRKSLTNNRSIVSDSSRKLLMFLILLFGFISLTFGQVLNDYRSIATGNWTTLTTWQRFNGTSWVAATNYPGQVAGTNNVFIRSGHTVTLNADINQSFTSLTIGDETGATDVLAIPADRYLNTPLVTIKSDGFMQWLPNQNYTFSLPAGAQIVIRTGGLLDTSGSCSASRRIRIGVQDIAICNPNSNAAPNDFQEVMDAGGTANLVDTDVDGVKNYQDLDDDNDGIYDTVELGNCPAASPSITREIFYENFGVAEGSSYPITYANYTYQAISGGYVPGQDVNDGEYTIYNNIQATASWAPAYWQSIGDHTTGTGNMGIFNASNPGGEFYRRTLSVVDVAVPIDVSFWAMNLDKTSAPSAGSRILPNITVNFVQNNVVVSTFNTGDIAQYPNGSAAAWRNFQFSFTPTSSNPITLVLVNNRNPGAGNDLALDDILVTQSFCDQDGDGIINSLEIDSDGDGCTDANEAYGNPNADGEATDNDGLGYYGTGNPPAVNANGTVVAASYQTPVDANGNGVFDYTEAGTSPVITTQPANQIFCATGTATFNVISAGSNTYQWQISTNGGATFSNITNGGNYAGATTSILTVNNVTSAYNNHQFRVLIKRVGFICGTTTSNNATITVNPLPSAPTVGTITQPTCTVATGSVVLSGLPAGNWTLTRNPGAVVTNGTGASTTISGLAAGTYTYTVTNAAGCTSAVSGNVVINAQPAPLQYQR